MPWEVDGDIGVDPQAGIDWFRSRVPLTRAAWDSLSEQARSNAFFITGLASLDLAQETMDALDYAISQGKTFEDFKGRLSERVTKVWGGASPYRLQTIFDANLQLAYGAGRYDAATELKAERLYWGLEVVLDGRTSRICRPLAGTVLPADSPFWQTHIPLLHFRCRTALVTYSEAQARQVGITEQPPLEGFGRPPNLARWEPDLTDYDPELWAAYARQRGARSPSDGVPPYTQGRIPGVEMQPRLDPQQLPGDERIPNDKMLRGASPVEVVGNVAAWLRDNFPTAKPAKYRIARDARQLEREAARWARKQGVEAAMAAAELRSAAAAHYRGELLVLPPHLEVARGQSAAAG